MGFWEGFGEDRKAARRIVHLLVTGGTRDGPVSASSPLRALAVIVWLAGGVTLSDGVVGGWFIGVEVGERMSISGCGCG